MPDMSEKQVPLFKLIKKGVRWKWTDEQEIAFVNLKNEFANNLKIYHPQYDKPFILRTQLGTYQEKQI